MTPTEALEFEIIYVSSTQEELLQAFYNSRSLHFFWLINKMYLPMGSNLSNHQFQIDCYMKILYISLMVTTNQKILIDMQRIERKESNYNY